MPPQVRSIGSSRDGQDAVTLMELIVVIIIIGIIAGITLPSFTRQGEDARNKDAIASLKLIWSAQRTYRNEVSTYYPSAGSVNVAATINANLKLALPEAANADWIYTVYSTGCGQAQRNGDDARLWYLRITDNGSVPGNCNLDGQPNTNACYACP